MYEPREFTTSELLTWNRFLSQTLLGLALAWARERDGSVDGFVQFARGHLEQVWEGMGAGGVEAATLALQLNAEAFAGQSHSHAVNPESGEVIVDDLPGERLCQELEYHFDIDVTPEALREVAGLNQEEMNRLYDLLAAVVDGAGYGYQREDHEGGRQRLIVRA